MTEIYSGKVGARTVLTSQSGLDIPQIVNSLVQAKSSPIDKMTAKKEMIQSQQSGLNAISAAMNALKDSLTSLRSPIRSENVFQKISAYYSSSDFFLDTGASSQPMEMSIQIQQIASNKIASLFTNNDLIIAGQLNFTSSGVDYSINLSEGESLGSIATKINNNTDLLATVVTTSPGTQELIVQGNVADDWQVSSPLEVKQSAQNAILKIDGIQIETKSNDINLGELGFAPGVTMNVFQPTSTPIDVSIDFNRQQVVEQVQQMVDRYNDFVDTFQEVAGPGTTGILRNEPIIRDIKSGIINDLMSNSSFGSSRDLGLSIDSLGRMSIDIDKLADSLNTNYEAVKNHAMEIGLNLNQRFSNYERNIQTLDDAYSSRALRYDQNLIKLQSNVEDYRIKMLEKFSQMERNLAALNSMKSQLIATMEGLNS